MRRVLGLGLAAISLFVLGGVSAVSAASDTTVQELEAQGPAPTASQMLEKARAILADAERSTQSATQSLRSARKENDVVKSLCLDDKLAQLEVARATVEERVLSLEGAIQANNAEGIEHDFSVVSALGDRIGSLANEAGQCIGEDRTSEGTGSSLQVTFDPAIPTTDTSSLPLGPNISTPPLAASATF